MSTGQQRKVLREQRRRPRVDEIDLYGITHRGLRRRTNQDHFLIGSLGARLDVQQTSLPDVITTPAPEDRQAILAIVADGVGGTAGGEEASRLTVGAAARHVAQSTQALFTAGAPDDVALSRALEAAARRCHNELRGRAESHAETAGMATTLTLWLGVWPRAY